MKVETDEILLVFCMNVKRDGAEVTSSRSIWPFTFALQPVCK